MNPREVTSSGTVQGMKKVLEKSTNCAFLFEFWPYALRGCKPEELLAVFFDAGFTIGKATAAPYPMSAKRILKQAAAIAAYHSKARQGGTVPVSCTRARFVTKPRGAQPGTVQIRKESVLKVRPCLP